MSDTRTIYDIRTAFENRLHEAYTLIIGLDVAMGLGMEKMEADGKDSPNFGYKMVMRREERGTLKPMNYETVHFKANELVAALEARHNLHLELVQGLMVQWWYQFMQEFYEWALLKKGQSAEEVSKAGRTFDFDKGHKKLNILCGALDVDVASGFNLWPDESKNAARRQRFEDAVLRQKIHIVIRNAVVHSNGLLRTDHLKILGGQQLVVVDETQQEKEYKEGDHVILSVVEVLEGMRAFTELARAVVGLRVRKFPEP